MAAIWGNVILNPPYLVIFIEYLIPTLLVVFFMLYHNYILRAALYAIDYLSPKKDNFWGIINKKTKNKLAEVSGRQFVFLPTMTM